MKKAKAFLIGSFILIGIFFLAPFILPKKAKAESSIVIKTNDVTLFPFIADFTNWKTWSSWYQKDTTAVYTFSENQNGVGADMSWKSDNAEVGIGNMQITQYIKYKEFQYEQNFESLKAKNTGKFKVEEINENEVKLTWTHEMDLPYPFVRWMNVFVNMGEIMQKEFDASLTNLKTQVEKSPLVKLPSLIVDTVQVEDKIYLGLWQMSKKDSLDKAKEITYELLKKEAETSKAIVKKASPKICMFHARSTSQATIQPCIELQGCTVFYNAAVCLSFRKGKALKFTYYGDVNKMDFTYVAIDRYIKKNQFSLREKYYWEEYVLDYTTEKDTSKWMTNIYYMLNE